MGGFQSRWQLLQVMLETSMGPRGGVGTVTTRISTSAVSVPWLFLATIL